MAANLKALLKSLTPPQFWGFLRTARHRWELATFRKRTVTHSYGGKSLQVYLSDPNSVDWYDHDYPPLPEIEILRRSGFAPNTRIFDIGAHQCVMAMMLAEAVGPQGTVLAVEALPHHAEVGARNVRSNGYRNVQVLHAAAAETSGKTAFTIGEHIYRGKEDPDGKLWVDAYSIDDLAARFGRPDILYIDIEGYECRVLHGAAQTLATHPDCFVEMHVGCGLEAFGGSVESVVAFFPHDHYQLFARPQDEEKFFPLNPVQGGLSDARLKNRFFLLAIHR